MTVRGQRQKNAVTSKVEDYRGPGQTLASSTRKTSGRAPLAAAAPKKKPGHRPGFTNTASKLLADGSLGLVGRFLGGISRGGNGFLAGFLCSSNCILGGILGCINGFLASFLGCIDSFPPIPEPADPYFTLYQASLGASWQLDLFGRVRRLTEAAQAQVYASEQAQRGVVLTVVTSVSSSYIVMRALDRQLEIAQSTAANFGETARIFDRRFEAGIVSQTEVSQIRSQHQQALAAIPAIGQQVAAQENLISILLGRNPGPNPRGKTIHQLAAPPNPADAGPTPNGRCADILQAEQNLVAANASIGAARALYYPTISLTGLLGSVTTAFGDFLSGPATAWSLAAGLAGPIFTFGAIEGQVSSAEAGQRSATLAYQATIANAFRETNDALVGTRNKAQEQAMQEQRVVALRQFAHHSKRRFDAGLAGYLDVLVAENELFAAELASVRTQADRYTQLVAVYQAVGGGWVDVAGSMAPKAQSLASTKP